VELRLEGESFAGYRVFSQRQTDQTLAFRDPCGGEEEPGANQLGAPAPEAAVLKAAPPSFDGRCLRCLRQWQHQFIAAARVVYDG
jgi:hypothetical protein